MDSKVLEEIEQKAKMKISKQQLQKLVTDHLTMACKTALADELNFTFEGLIGITLSSNEVLLINVKENVSNQMKALKDKKISVDNLSDALKKKLEQEKTSDTQNIKFSSKRKPDKKGNHCSSPSVKRSRTSLPPQKIKPQQSTTNQVKLPVQTDVEPELEALRKLTNTKDAPNQQYVDSLAFYSMLQQQSLLNSPFFMNGFHNAPRPTQQPPPPIHPLFASRQYPTLSEDDSRNSATPPIDEDKKPSSEAIDMTSTKIDEYNEETDVNMNKTTPLKLLANSVIEKTTKLNGDRQMKRGSSCEPNRQQNEHNGDSDNDVDSNGRLLDFNDSSNVNDLTNICPQCGVTLSTNTALKRHMLIHDGVKPYICTVCDKKFRQKTDLQRHLCTHTKKYPFSCPLCEFKCVARHSLKAHGRNKHNMPELHHSVIPASLDELVPMADYHFDGGLAGSTLDSKHSTGSEDEPTMKGESDEEKSPEALNYTI